MSSVIKKVYRLFRQYRWVKVLENSLYSMYKHEVAELYYAKNGNFGDELNNDLMSYFDIPYRRSRSLGADLCCIGSNLEVFTSSDKKPLSTRRSVDILGPGFIEPSRFDEEHFMFNMNIHALRGRISKDRCESILGRRLNNITLGDPGLLIHRIFPSVKRTNQYDVGIICHFVDRDDERLVNVKLSGMKVLIIDVKQKTEDFVQQVAQCDFILSSAMHGLICADSLGIPNKHIVLSDKLIGGEYKFKDYYSVFPKFVYKPVYLKDTIITNDSLHKYKKEYTISQQEVEKICNNLDDAFRKYKKSLS